MHAGLGMDETCQLVYFLLNLFEICCIHIGDHSQDIEWAVWPIFLFPKPAKSGTILYYVMKYDVAEAVRIEATLSSPPRLKSASAMRGKPGQGRKGSGEPQPSLGKPCVYSDEE